MLEKLGFQERKTMENCVLENDCLRILVGVSCMNHIKMNDLEISNKIIDIIKMKIFKWFGHMV